MQMKDMIRTKRRECGYTQEQVAAYLGVSAPAVNKWESGATFPDVALLSPLARLLKTDVNTLLCFRENLTKEDVMMYIAEVSALAKEESIRAALEKTRELVQEYPSCVELLHQLATTLTGLSIIVPGTPEQKEEVNVLATELYERVAASDVPEYANRARFMLASRLIQEENYDQAKQLIEKMPQYDGLDKRHLEISIHMKKRESEKAGKLLEQKINQLIQEVFLQLDQLAAIAVWENDSERAEKLAEYGKQLMGIYGWDYSKYTVALTVAVEEKDADKCMELMKIMLSCLENPVDLTGSVLYTHIRKKEDPEGSSESNTDAIDNSARMAQQMKEALLACVENDEQFAFLREKYADVADLLKKGLNRW